MFHKSLSWLCNPKTSKHCCQRTLQSISAAHPGGNWHPGAWTSRPMASLQQRPRPFWLAFPRTKPQMQFCTPWGKHFQLLHPKRPKQKVKRPPAYYKSQQEKIFLPNMLFFFSPSSLLGPRNYPPPASLQSRGTCHFAQGLEPHPPDTCQAGAETPPGCLPLAPEPRPVTLLQALRVCGGQGGTLIPPGPGPQRRRAPARRDGARRDASSGRLSRVPAAAAALLAYLARGRSSGPLSCSGSSSVGGGGGGAGGAAAEAAATLRGALGGMTPCPSRSRRAVRRAG